MIPQPIGDEESPFPATATINATAASVGLTRAGWLEGGAQPAHGGIAVISNRMVLLGAGVRGFDELDRAHRAQSAGALVLDRFLVGGPAGDRIAAVLPPRGAD